MVYVFLAVLIVLVIMNVFMLFILRQMAGAAGRQIERDAGRLFGMYDQMLEEKSRRLELLKEEEEKFLLAMEKKRQEERENGFSKAVPKGPKPQAFTAVFRDSSFARTYNQVRQSFGIPVSEMVRELCQSLPKDTEKEREWRSVLEGMRQILTFENLYQISILPLKRQEELLAQVFDGKQLAVYEEWKKEHPNGSAVDFSQWLEGAFASVSDQVTVRSSPAQAAEPEEGVCWEADPAICEGIKLIYRDRLYDYSIDDRLE